MDKIFISELELRSVIGTLPQERLAPQSVFADLELQLDLSGAGKNDALELSVDYSQVEEAVLQIAEQSSFLLLEALAEAIAEKLLSFSPVSGCRVRLFKPGASSHSKISIELNRSRCEKDGLRRLSRG